MALLLSVLLVATHLFHLVDAVANPRLLPPARSSLNLRDRSVPQCNGLDDFCSDFKDLCIKDCVLTHQPRGFDSKTPVSYKCDHSGGQYYNSEFCFPARQYDERPHDLDFGRPCDGHDITSGVLEQISDEPRGGSSPSHTATVTKIVTGTQTVTKDLNFTRTTVKTTTIYPTRTITVKFRSTSTLTTNDVRTVVVHAQATDIVTKVIPTFDVIPTTVTDVETEYTTLTDFTTSTDFTTATAASTSYTTETDAAYSTVFSTGTDIVDVTRTITDVTIIPTTVVATITTTISDVETVLTVYSTQTVVVPVTDVSTVVRTSTVDIASATTPSPTTINVFTSVIVVTSTSTLVQTSVSLGPANYPRSGFQTRDGNSAMCQAYGNACTQLCGGHTSDVREGYCGLLKSDVYELQCQCKNGKDETQAALCFTGGAQSGPTSTVTVTSAHIVTKTVTDLEPVQTTVWRTHTAPFATITKTATIQEFIVTKVNHLRTTVTLTNTTTLTDLTTSTAFTTLTNFETDSTVITTSTTDVIGETDVVTVTVVDGETITNWVTEPTSVYATITQTSTIIATAISTTFSPVTSTETDTATTTVPFTASATSTVTSTSTYVSVYTSIAVTTDVHITTVPAPTVGVTKFTTSTTVVPYTTVHVISPTGVISGGGSSYISGSAFNQAALDFGTLDTALNVVLLQPVGTDPNAVLIYALNPPPGATTAERYVGATDAGTRDIPWYNYQGWCPLTLVGYADEGPSSPIPSYYSQVYYNGALNASAVIFQFNPLVSSVLQPFWTAPNGSTYNLLVIDVGWGILLNIIATQNTLSFVPT